MKNILFALSAVSMGVAVASNAYAAWGCGAQNSGGAWGDSFAESNKNSAQKKALSGCEQSRQPGEPPCRIVGRSPNINSGDQADAKWEVR